jgi:hypothetical protein
MPGPLSQAVREAADDSAAESAVVTSASGRAMPRPYLHWPSVGVIAVTPPAWQRVRVAAYNPSGSSRLTPRA